MAVQDVKQQTPYRVIQLEWDAEKGERNEAVGNFDELVTHHPKSNSDAYLVNGKVVGGQAGRTLGVVGGEIQEIEVSKAGKDYSLRPCRLPVIQCQPKLEVCG